MMYKDTILSMVKKANYILQEIKLKTHSNCKTISAKSRYKKETKHFQHLQNREVEFVGMKVMRKSLVKLEETLKNRLQIGKVSKV